MGIRNQLAWHAQGLVTCRVSEGTSPQLFQDLQEHSTECLAHTTWFWGFQKAKTLVDIFFQHFKAWAEPCCLLSLASPRTEEISELGYFCCWLFNLTLTARTHKLHPEALTQSHRKVAGRRNAKGFSLLLETTPQLYIQTRYFYKAQRQPHFAKPWHALSSLCRSSRGHESAYKPIKI